MYYRNLESTPGAKAQYDREQKAAAAARFAKKKS